jgi:hypothetical protein
MSEKITENAFANHGPFFAYSHAAEQYGYDYNSVVNGFLLDSAEEGERNFYYRECL